MISTQLVLIAIAAEAATVVIGLGLLTGHGAWFRVRERRLGPRLSAARGEIVAGLSDGTSGELSVALLEGLPQSACLHVLGDLQPSVAGAQRDQLRDLARRAGLLDRASRLCRSRRWTRRLRGARMHTLLGGGEEPMPELLQDQRAAVRAEAAAWSAEHPQREIIDRLIALLRDEATLCRFTVKDSLLRLGPAAVQPIAEHLATASGGNAAAALEVAVALRDARLLDAGFRLLGDGLPIVRRRAVELLGALGGERAAASITAALEDPAAEVRAAAATALGRGNHRAAAARLAAALRDSSWDVRRAAGMSLRQLGAPGELLLERMVADTDRFAGDMARLMIELPRAV